MQDTVELKQKVRRGTVRRMLRFAVPYVGLLSLFLLGILISVGVSLVNPLIYREIIDEGILKGDAALIVRFAVLAGLIGLLADVLAIAQSYLSATIGARVVLSLRTQLYEHIMKMPLAFFTRVQTGALMSRLNADVTGAQGTFTALLSNIVGNAVTFVLVLGVMFALSWQMTLAALILIPFFIWPARVGGRKLQKISLERYSLIAAMNNLMVEHFSVAGAHLTKLFGNRQYESSQFEARATRVAQIGIKSTVYSQLFAAAITLVATFGTVYAYGWGGLLVVRHELDLGSIVAFVSYLGRLYSALSGLSSIQVTVMTALVSFDRVFEVLDLSPAIQEDPHALAIPKGAARIAFDHVSFRYPRASEISLASLESVCMPDEITEETVLTDITLVAEPGQLVALVGPSGAGKTTISHLITRLYDVKSGSVSINGIDVRHATLDSIHERVGVVTESAHFFHDTIRENLLYGKQQATDGELWDALQAAQILPLISSLPAGLDTMVGESGYRFSGGERQRLAIARLLLKAPDVIILDEATAHLDSESEVHLQRAIETALQGRTSIVIAHRLSTILRADQILVLNQGRIVDRGTHAELLERGGLYAELYHRQFASPTAREASA